MNQIQHDSSEQHDRILSKINELYMDLFEHNGFGKVSIDMRFLKKGQKEIILSYGKEFRYVVDYPFNKKEEK